MVFGESVCCGLSVLLDWENRRAGRGIPAGFGGFGMGDEVYENSASFTFHWQLDGEERRGE